MNKCQRFLSSNRNRDPGVTPFSLRSRSSTAAQKARLPLWDGATSLDNIAQTIAAANNLECISFGNCVELLWEIAATFANVVVPKLLDVLVMTWSSSSILDQA
jgi:hypothetical protein